MTRINPVAAACAVLLVAGGPLATGPAVQAQDPQVPGEGQTKALQCVACHGPAGISPNPMFPHLAGQNASYLQIQLENFRSGERYHPLMSPIAQSLSEEDIAELAAYFSSIGPLAAAGNVGRSEQP